MHVGCRNQIHIDASEPLISVLPKTSFHLLLNFLINLFEFIIFIIISWMKLLNFIFKRDDINVCLFYRAYFCLLVFFLLLLVLQLSQNISWKWKTIPDAHKSFSSQCQQSSAFRIFIPWWMCAWDPPDVTMLSLYEYIGLVSVFKITHVRIFFKATFSQLVITWIRCYF